MRDQFLGYLQGGAGRFGGQQESAKKNKGIQLGILMLAMGVFFCAFSEKNVLAEKNGAITEKVQIAFKPESVENINELKNIDSIFDNLDSKENCVAEASSSGRSIAIAEAKIEASAPEKRKEVSSKDSNFLCDFVLDEEAFKNKDLEKKCAEEKEDENIKYKKEKINRLIIGYPLEKMINYISKREERVAYYLVAIAKKESDWGKHAPKKNGDDCYNYWGYRGTYNQTDSGYSCFDSPEQAIQAVGDRIEDLLDKKIDTPEKFIVWKCGSTCAGHDPQGVLKWISDVKLYYRKLST